MRQMIIDFLTPLNKSLGKLKNQIDFLQNFQYGDRAKLEEFGL